jgi:hypothetical protein
VRVVALTWKAGVWKVSEKPPPPSVQAVSSPITPVFRKSVPPTAVM